MIFIWQSGKFVNSGNKLEQENCKQRSLEYNGFYGMSWHSIILVKFFLAYQIYIKRSRSGLIKRAKFCLQIKVYISSNLFTNQ